MSELHLLMPEPVICCCGTNVKPELGEMCYVSWYALCIVLSLTFEVRCSWRGQRAVISMVTTRSTRASQRLQTLIFHVRRAAHPLWTNLPSACFPMSPRCFCIIKLYECCVRQRFLHSVCEWGTCVCACPCVCVPISSLSSKQISKATRLWFLVK